MKTTSDTTPAKGVVMTWGGVGGKGRCQVGRRHREGFLPVRFVHACGGDREVRLKGFLTTAEYVYLTNVPIVKYITECPSEGRFV